MTLVTLVTLVTFLLTTEFAEFYTETTEQETHASCLVAFSLRLCMLFIDATNKLVIFS
jgi:hypothetical protein